MLYRVTRLRNSKVIGRDEPAGHLADAYFDDREWIVRLLVAESGVWFRRRRTLIAPAAAAAAFDWQSRIVRMSLLRREIQEAPSIGTERLTSRRPRGGSQQDCGGFMDWPYAAFSMWGAVPGVALDSKPESPCAEEPPAHGGEAPALFGGHLHSVRDVLGYHIEASDAPAGQVTDLLFDDSSWVIRHLIVDVGSWFAGKQVRIATGLIEEVNWVDHSFVVKLSSEGVRNSPLCAPTRERFSDRRRRPAHRLPVRRA